MEEKKLNSRKLTEEQIDQVSGGFVQEIEGAWSYGERIVCPNPNCKNSKWNRFTCDSDELASVQKDLYTCLDCGQQFTAATGYGITDIL